MKKLLTSICVIAFLALSFIVNVTADVGNVADKTKHEKQVIKSQPPPLFIESFADKQKIEIIEYGGAAKNQTAITNKVFENG
jgi:hypothetical protein